MAVVAKGKANLIVHGPNGTVFRLCVRYEDSLSANNQYNVQNEKYIMQTVAPLLCTYIASMRFLVMPIEYFKDDYSKYVSNLDVSTINVFQMQNLKSDGLQEVFHSHFTKCYMDKIDNGGTFLIEFKPKWLFDQLKYCRNCTHNIMKHVNDLYCYKLILKDPNLLKDILSDTVPEFWLNKLIDYFQKETNVLHHIYRAQEIAFKRNDVALLMTLRDVTCFIEFNRKNNFFPMVNIIDVDYKPVEKKDYWKKTQNKIDSMINKIYH